MVTLQEQSRALGDPTRHEIFRYVAEGDDPVDVRELTEHFGLNHNAIRQHLAKLVDADLVIEDTAPATGRGRPRLLYRLSPTADSRWGVQGPYERLSGWLVEMVRTGDSPYDVGRRAGREAGADARSDEADGLSALVDAMARQGFEPIVRRRSRASVDVVLGNCPFSSTALADPDTVCALHLGMAEGLADGLPGVEVDELVRKDPRRAGCRLRCRTTDD